jgi:hypothetical protein
MFWVIRRGSEDGGSRMVRKRSTRRNRGRRRGKGSKRRERWERWILKTS